MGNKNTIEIEAILKDMFSKQAKDIKDQIDGISTSSNKSSGIMGTLGGAFGKVASIAGGIISAQIFTRITDGISEMGTAIWNTSLQLGEFQGKLTTIFKGDQKQVSDFMSKFDLSTLNIPNQTIDQVREYGLQLVNAGYSSEKASKLMAQFGDVSTILGADKLPILVDSFAKVQARGYMTQRELVNMKALFGEGLPQAFGMSDEKLTEMVDNGKISIADMNKAVGNLTTGTGKYAGAMANYENTIAGAWDKVGDKFTMIKEKFATALAPTFSLIIDKIIQLVTTIETKLTPVFKRFADDPTFQKVLQTIWNVLSGIADIIVNFVIGAFEFLWRVWNKISPDVERIGNALNKIFGYFSKVISSDDIANTGQQLENTFTDMVVSIIDQIATALEDFVTWLGSEEGQRALKWLRETMEKIFDAFDSFLAWLTDPATKKGFEDFMSFVKPIIFPFQTLLGVLDDVLNKMGLIEQKTANASRGGGWSGAGGFAGGTANGGIGGGGIGGVNAVGTDYWKGGFGVVGETGREVVNLPKGSQIKSASNSSMGGNLTIQIMGNVIGMDNFKNVIVDAVKQAQANDNRLGRYNLSI